MPLKLRPAATADLPALRKVFPDTALPGNLAPRSPDDTRILVAEENGVPAGLCLMRSGPRPGDLEIVALAVAPDHRGKGLGALLLTRVEDEARSRGLERLVALPHGFLEARGFRPRPGSGAGSGLTERPLPPAVHEVRSLHVAVAGTPWAFETRHQSEIDAHFEAARQRIGLLWNGRTLKLTGYSFQDGVFDGRCSESSYAAHLAWRDWGAPDPNAFNLFGSALLRSSDGALLFGVMAAHTATGGLVYPPGGNLDPTDLKADGTVDVVGAIYRELGEETGLEPADVRAGPLLVTFDGPRISLGLVMDVDRDAEDLRGAILAHSEATEEKELADIRIIRAPEDADDAAVVSYARAIARHLLA